MAARRTRRSLRGSSVAHRMAEAEFLEHAADALQEAKAMKTCTGRVNMALHVIRNASRAVTEDAWAGVPNPRKADRLLIEAQAMIRACIRPDSGGVSGARRRRGAR